MASVYTILKFHDPGIQYEPPQDVEEYRQALAEMQHADDRRVLVSHLLDHSFLQWWSSAYRDAHWNAVESLTILSEGDEENPHLSTAYHIGQYILSLTLLTLGEWGEALRVLDTAIAMLEKNGDDGRAQILLLVRAWVHLHAMDFPGVLAICTSVLPALGDAARIPARRFCLMLAGAAETALGHYRRALEHLVTVAGRHGAPEGGL